MADPFIGEIRMFGGSFAPAGWAFCDGQLMPISENEALFVLIGTTYGGDGQETFALPNLQSRIPIHAGQGPGVAQNYQLGEMAGSESVTLGISHIPSHNHPLLASTSGGTSANATGHVLSSSPSISPYVEGETPASGLAANTLGPIGGSQPHENLMPYLVVSYIISLFGLFPSQT